MPVGTLTCAPWFDGFQEAQDDRRWNVEEMTSSLQRAVNTRLVPVITFAASNARRVRQHAGATGTKKSDIIEAKLDCLKSRGAELRQDAAVEEARFVDIDRRLDSTRSEEEKRPLLTERDLITKNIEAITTKMNAVASAMRALGGDLDADLALIDSLLPEFKRA